MLPRVPKKTSAKCQLVLRARIAAIRNTDVKAFPHSFKEHMPDFILGEYATVSTM